MADFSKFRTAVSGFNRTDVVNYIESASMEHQKALRKLTAVISKSNCTVIFINQLREKVGVMFGNPEASGAGTGGQRRAFRAGERARAGRL